MVEIIQETFQGLLLMSICWLILAAFIAHIKNNN